MVTLVSDELTLSEVDKLLGVEALDSESSLDSRSAQLDNKETQNLPVLKAPPGPKPSRFGDDVQWFEPTHRWKRVSERVRDGHESINDQHAQVTQDEGWDGVKLGGSYLDPNNEALQHYTGQGYWRINRELRGGEVSETVGREVKALLDLVEPIGDSPILYRGTRLAEEPVVGQVLQFNGFTSTSRSAQTAYRFMMSDDSVLLELAVDPDVGAIKLRGREYETILEPATEVVIDEIKKIVGRTLVVGRVTRGRGGVDLQKSPPGPPPRPGLQWRERTKRWIRPKESMPRELKVSDEGLAGFWAKLQPDDIASFVATLDSLDDVEIEYADGIQGHPTYVNIDDHIALQDYVVGSNWNQSLRMGKEITNPHSLEMIRGMLAVMSPMDDPLTLYRGVADELWRDSDRDLQVGDILQLDGFTSTSRRPKIAFDFAKGATVLEIRTDSDTSAVSIYDEDVGISPEIGEHETILNLGLRLRVDEIYHHVPYEYATDDYAEPGELVAVETYVVCSVVPEIEGEPAIVPESRDWEAQLEQVGGQGGSQPGGKFRDRDTGEEYYVKWLGDDRNKSEALASQLYLAAGVRVPDARVVEWGDQTAVVSPWVEGAESMTTWQMERSPEVRDHFIVDAWLANWDVVGLAEDNIVQADGKAYRIDPGGALAYRAMGAPKEFGPVVAELDTMRDPYIAPQASRVFTDLTDAELQRGVDAVGGVSDIVIDSLVAQSDLPAETRNSLAWALKSRRDYIVSWWEGSLEVQKAVSGPPGPPPRPGLVWRGRTHRCVRPGALSDLKGNFRMVDQHQRVVDAEGDDGELLDSAKYIDPYTTGNGGIADYVQGEDWYQTINDSLRAPWLGTLHEAEIAIKQMLDAVTSVEEDQTLYRGIEGAVTQGLEVGKAYRFDAFTSASRSSIIANEFVYGSGIMLEMHVPPGVGVIQLASNEHETILAPGTCYQVDEETKVDGVRVLVGQVLDDCPVDAIQKSLTPGPPPGPKPKRYGEHVDWDPVSHRWVGKPTKVASKLGPIGEKPPGYGYPPLGGLKWVPQEGWRWAREESDRYPRPREGEYDPTQHHPEVTEAIVLYAGSVYEGLNSAMRSGGELSETEQWVAERLVLAATPWEVRSPNLTDDGELEFPKSVDRGLQSYSEFKSAVSQEGLAIVDSFWSSSTNILTALNFTGTEEGIRLRVAIEPGVPVVNLPDGWMHRDEDEVIILPGAVAQVDNWVEPKRQPDFLGGGVYGEASVLVASNSLTAEDRQEYLMLAYEKTVIQSLNRPFGELPRLRDQLPVEVGNDLQAVGSIARQVYRSVESRDFEAALQDIGELREAWKAIEMAVASEVVELREKAKSNYVYDDRADSLESWTQSFMQLYSNLEGKLTNLGVDLQKGPPGPPPRPGLQWRERTKRWIRPVADRGVVEVGGGFDILQDTWSDFAPKDAPTYVNAGDSYATDLYVTGTYGGLNESLRYNDELEGGEIEVVEGLEELMSPLEEPQTLYRGLQTELYNDGGMPVQVGDVLTVDSYMSCSRVPDTALELFGGYSGTFMEVLTTSNTQGITFANDDVEQLGVPGEDETLLGLGQYAKVIEVHRDVRLGGSTLPLYVVMEVSPSLELQKAPPGPPPRKGLVWYEPTHRWRRPAQVGQPERDWGTVKEDFEVGQRVRVSEKSRAKWARGQEATVLELDPNPAHAGVLIHVDGAPKPGWISFKNLEVLYGVAQEATPVESEAMQEAQELVDETPVALETSIEVARPDFKAAWAIVPDVREVSLGERLEAGTEVVVAVDGSDYAGVSYSEGLSGVVMEKVGYNAYLVELENGNAARLNAYNMRIPIEVKVSTDVDVGQTEAVPIANQRTYYDRRWRDRWGRLEDWFTDVYSTPMEAVNAVYGEYDYQGLLERTLQDTAIYMAMKPAAFNKVMASEQFLNAAQAGKGTFTKGSAVKMVDRYNGVESTTLGVRSRVAQALEYGVFAEGEVPDGWDSHRKVPAKELDALPKYGFLASKDSMDYGGIVGWGYGDLYVKFKESAKQKATWTLGNSYDGNSANIVPPTSVLMPEADMALTGLYDHVIERVLSPPLHGKEVDELTRGQIETRREVMQRWRESADWRDLKSLNFGPYIEAQLYGEVTLDDVAAVQVGSARQGRRLRRALDKIGRSDIEVEPLMFDERLAAISSTDYDKEPSLTAEDVDLLGDYYIEKLFKLRSREYVSSEYGVQTAPEVLSAISNLEQVEPTTDDIRSYVTSAYLYTYKLRGEEGERELARLQQAFEEGGVKELEQALYGSPTEIKVGRDGDTRLQRILRGATSRARDRYRQDLPISVKREAIKAYWEEMAKGPESKLPEEIWSRWKKSKAGFTKDVWNQQLLQGPIVEG